MIIKDFNSAKQTIDLENPELFRRLTQCPICMSSSIEFAITSHDNHYGVRGEYENYRCKDCFVFFLNPMPTEAFLSKAYPQDYYAYQEFRNESRLKRVVKMLLFLGDRTKDPFFMKPGVALDVGCGNGEFLWEMHQRGWETLGVEPSESAAGVGNKQPGLKIYNGTLLSAAFPAAYFDYVRSNHSLEHILNPHENKVEIARIMKSGGKLFIGVPNTDSYAFALFKKYWWNLGAPQHPINYNEGSLKRLVLPYGFKLVSSRTNSNFTGLLGSYQIQVNNSRSIRRDTGFLLTFLPLKIASGLLSKTFDLFKKGDCLEMVFEKV